MIRRRDFITLLGGAAAWPLAARAQQPDRPRRIGVLFGLAENDPESQIRIAAIREELHRRGWTAGHNLRFDFRWAAGDAALTQAFAKELVELQPDVIISQATPATTALLRETRTVPIVFAQVSDPVGAAFVQSFARPGGNVTGFSNYEYNTIGGKWLELLKQIAPNVRRVGVIFNPDTTPFEVYLQSVGNAAPAFSVQAIPAPARDAAGVEREVATFAREAGGGLLVLPDIFTGSHRMPIIAAAARHALPAIYPFRFFATNGGLIAYGVEPLDIYRRTAGYVDRILRGEKPGDLPVQAPTKYELVINLKTARALALEVPPTLIARADEVIE